MDGGKKPLPEGKGLDVRIVDPEDLDALLNPEEDDEIATFMNNRGADSGRTSISSGEELGCV